jgi:DedD protein
MAFFKFRKGSDATPAATPQPESVEALRRRARHRLIGAAVLVLLAVIGFPLLFDTQPRPIAVDIPIEIPDRAKVKPLPVPPQSHVQGAVTTPDSPARVAAAPADAASQGTAAPAASGKPAARAQNRDAGPVVDAPKSAAPAQQAKAETTAAKPAPDTAKPVQAADGGRVQPVREDKPGKAQEADGRFVVQVGAFADAGKARETRLRVEKAGLKTYTHVAETRDGRRIRVRVGPFATRAEADKAASRIKELDLPAAILTL